MEQMGTNGTNGDIHPTRTKSGQKGDIHPTRGNFPIKMKQPGAIGKLGERKIDCRRWMCPSIVRRFIDGRGQFSRHELINFGRIP
jgi:hypothetical protein